MPDAVDGANGAISLERFAVIGDLHIGRPDASLSFTDLDGRTADWLTELLATWGTVIVNGDLYDLDRGRWPLRHAHELATVRALQPALCAAFEQPGIVRIVGNHDAELLLQGGAVERLQVQWAGRTVRLEHGHRFDAPIKQFRRFTQAVTWASGRVAEGPLRPVYRLMRSAEAVATGEFRSARASGNGSASPRSALPGFDRRVHRWLWAQHDIDVLVIGHTHRAGVWPVGDRVLVNAGESTGPVLRAACFDGPRATIDLVTWSESDATVRQTHALPSRRGNPGNPGGRG